MINFLLLLWILFGTILGQFIILFIGYTFLYFLPKSNEFPTYQKLAISYGLGVGMMSFSMFIFILLGVHSRISFLPILIISIILFSYFKMYRTLINDIKPITKFKKKKLNFNYIEYFCLFIIFLELFLIISICLIYPIYLWDPAVIWNPKAIFIFYDGNFSFFEYYFVHSTYPILIPLNLTFFYSLYSQPHSFVQLTFAFFLIFLLLFLYYSMRHLNLSRTYSILISTMISSIYEFFILSTQITGDIILTFYYTLSTIFLSYYIISKKRHYLVYSSIFAGFMAFTKIEGLGLFLVNICILFMYNIRLLLKKQIKIRVSLRDFCLFVIIGLIIYIPWQIFSLYNQLVSEYILNLSEIFNIQNFFYVLFLLLIAVFLEFLWCPFWIILILVILFNREIIFEEKVFFLLILAISHLLLKFFIYFITPYEITWQLMTSFNREFLHLAPFAAFVLSYILSQKSNDNLLSDFNKNEDIFQKKILYYCTIFIICYMIFILIFNKWLYTFIPSVWHFLN